MSSRLPLGYDFNLGRNASGGTNRVSLRDCSAIAFVVDTPAAASTITIAEATAGTGGTSQPIGTAAATAVPVASALWTQTNGVWTLVPIVAGGNYVLSTGVLTLAGTPDLTLVQINQGALSDGFAFLSFSHSAKVGLYIAAPWDAGRKPSNARNIYA